MKKLLTKIRAIFSGLFTSGEIRLGKLPSELRTELTSFHKKAYEWAVRGKEYTLELSDQFKFKIRAYISPKLNALNMKIEDHKNHIRSLTLTLQKPFEEILKKHVAYLKPLCDEAVIAIHEKHGRFTELLNSAKNDRIAELTNLEVIKSIMKVIPSQKTFFDSVRAMIAFFILIATGEIFLSFDAMDALGVKWTLASFLLCVVFSICLAVSCHFFGHALANHNKKGAFFSLSVGILMTIFIMLLRAGASQADAPQIQEPNTGENYILVSSQQTSPNIDDKNDHHILLGLGNILMLFFGLILSERVNRNRPYFKSVAKISSLGDIIDELGHKITLKPIELQNAKNAYTALAVQKTHEEIRQNEAALKEHNAILAKTEANRNALLNTMECWEKETANAIKAAYIQGKNVADTLNL